MNLRNIIQPTLERSFYDCLILLAIQPELKHLCVTAIAGVQEINSFLEFYYRLSKDVH